MDAGNVFAGFRATGTSRSRKNITGGRAVEGIDYKALTPNTKSRKIKGSVSLDSWTSKKRQSVIDPSDGVGIGMSFARNHAKSSDTDPLIPVGIKDWGELVLQQKSGYFMLTGHKISPRTEE